MIKKRGKGRKERKKNEKESSLRSQPSLIHFLGAQTCFCDLRRIPRPAPRISRGSHKQTTSFQEFRRRKNGHEERNARSGAHSLSNRLCYGALPPSRRKHSLFPAGRHERSVSWLVTSCRKCSSRLKVERFVFCQINRCS